MSGIIIKFDNGTEIPKTFEAINKEARNAALALSKATIGTKEYVAASKHLDEVKEKQAALKKQTEAVASASDMLKKAWNNLPGAGMFNQVSESLGMAKQGVGGLISQFGLLKTALAGIGIGLLITAITTLINLFKTFTPVIDKVEQIMGGIGGIVKELTLRFQEFGAGLWSFLSGDFSEGLDQMSKSFNGLGDSMAHAYEEGVKLGELQQDLDDRNRGIVISNAQAEASINRLITASKNRTLAERERLDLLDKAEKIATEQFKKEQQLEQDNFKLLMETAKHKSRLNEEEILQLAEGTLAQEIEYARRGNLDDDLLKQIADKYAEMIKMEGQQNVLMEKINNQRDKLAEARAAKEEKEAAAREKIREKEDKELESWHTKYLEREDRKASFEDARRLNEEQKEQEHVDKMIKIAQDSFNEQIKMYELLMQKKEQLRMMDKTNQLLALSESIKFFSDLVDVYGKNEQLSKKLKKAAALVDIGMNLIKERSYNALAAAQFAATIPPPAGPALSAAYLAKANIASNLRAGFAVARLLAFQKGGWTGVGANNEPAGVVHKNEYVIPANITQNPAYSGILGILENARLKGYQTGGMVAPKNPLDFSRNTGQPSNIVGGMNMTELINYEKLGAVISENMKGAFYNLKVTNNLTETKEGLSTLLKLQNEWDV